MANKFRGTKGYAEQAGQLLVRYEKLSFKNLHAGMLDLMPASPGNILDIGSGTGRDAAYFAERGHRVVAVEPTDELRVPAAHLHGSPMIDWIDDGLPTLGHLVTRATLFDLIMLTAVWMHIDHREREIAMPILASLMQPDGIMIMSLRHGSVPSGRHMFDVSAEETIRLAGAADLTAVRNIQTESAQGLNRLNDVTWTKLAFKKGD